jgi:1-acyl-sn-glycerol-3-phosphate acyltransferase
MAVALVVIASPFPAFKHRALRVLTHKYLSVFTRIWLPLLGVYRIVEISGLEQSRSVQPALFVANHRGFMDALLLLGLLPGTGALIKARDTRQAAYRLLEHHFDLVGVDRHSLASIAVALEKSRRILERGTSLLVFPEGTRARSGRLQRFNRFAFQLAIDAGVSVVPVVIHSTQPFMSRIPGSTFPRRLNRYRIRCLDPEPARADDDPDRMAERVWRRMARELRQLDAGTVWESGDFNRDARHRPI